MDSEVQTLFSWCAKEETQHDFDVSYITLAFPLVVRMQTEKELQELQEESFSGSSLREGRRSQKVPRTVWSETPIVRTLHINESV